MSRLRPSWKKVGVFFFFFAVSSLIIFVQAMAASENAQVGATLEGAPLEGGHQETGHEAVVEGEQPGAHESGHGEGEGHVADRSGDLRDLVFRIINFALMVIILVWALKKADIKSLFSKRIEGIRQKLEALKSEKNEAEKKYHDIEAKLKAFEKERLEILAQYRREGETEKEKIIAEANLRVQQIIEQAEATIDQEMQSARNRLKQEVVNLASQKAEEILSRELTDADQDRLVQDFIEKVGKIH